MEGESDVYCNFYFYANANSFDFIILWTRHRIIIIIVIGTKTLYSVCPSTRQHVANYEWMSGVKAGRHSGTCLVIATLLWQMPHVASPSNGGDKFQCFVLQGVANWVNCAMNGGKLHVQPEVETPGVWTEIRGTECGCASWFSFLGLVSSSGSVALNV